MPLPIRDRVRVAGGNDTLSSALFYGAFGKLLSGEYGMREGGGQATEDRRRCDHVIVVESICDDLRERNSQRQC